MGFFRSLGKLYVVSKFPPAHLLHRESIAKEPTIPGPALMFLLGRTSSAMPCLLFSRHSVGVRHVRVATLL